MLTSVEQTIDRTTLVTIILVVVLLLIIYRSPVAILLPLVAIGSSYAVAVGLLGFLGQAGVNFSTLSEAYLVVIVFGVGTDYCLFIVSRFREELRRNEWKDARRLALERIGPVIAASALTVIIAFLALGISKFGLNQTTGYALAIGVGVTLLAALTLVPALMAIFGRWLFWPAGITGASREGSSIWQAVGRWVSRYPAVIAVTIILLLLVPYLALPGLTRSADMVNQLPQNTASVRGYRVITEHFPSGELSPLYILVEAPGEDLTAASSLQAIQSLSRSLANAPGVSRVD
jgi:RND superfamily putative drug exporter